jgi:hypothetical protein
MYYDNRARRTVNAKWDAMRDIRGGARVDDTPRDGWEGGERSPVC